MSNETPKPSFSAHQGEDGQLHVTEAGPQDIVTFADIFDVLRNHKEDWNEIDVQKLQHVDLGDHPEEVHLFLRRERRADGSPVIPTFVGPDNIPITEDAWQHVMEQVGPIYAAMIQVRATARRRSE